MREQEPSKDEPTAEKRQNDERSALVVGSKVEIFSSSQKVWYQDGVVTRVFSDAEGDWLAVRYDGTRDKEVQRYSEQLRVHRDSDQNNGKPKKEEQMKAEQMAKKQEHANKIEKPRSIEFSIHTEDSTEKQAHQKSLEQRKALVVGSKVEIFSDSQNKWFDDGIITEVFTDDEGDWLNVKYDGDRDKQIQRYSAQLRVKQPVRKEKSKSPSPTSSRSSRTSRGRRRGGKRGKGRPRGRRSRGKGARRGRGNQN